MVVLITGTARISLFCMGYILACFIFLWFGEDMLLKPVRKLLSMWMGLLIYCYLVIMAKCVLQVHMLLAYTVTNIMLLTSPFCFIFMACIIVEESLGL